MKHRGGRKNASICYGNLTPAQVMDWYAKIDRIRSKRVAERPKRVFLTPKVQFEFHPYRYGERYIPGDLEPA